jgi:hypothetical protein
MQRRLFFGPPNQVRAALGQVNEGAAIFAAQILLAHELIPNHIDSAFVLGLPRPTRRYEKD